MDSDEDLCQDFLLSLAFDDSIMIGIKSNSTHHINDVFNYNKELDNLIETNKIDVIVARLSRVISYVVNYNLYHILGAIGNFIDYITTEIDINQNGKINKINNLIFRIYVDTLFNGDIKSKDIILSWCAVKNNPLIIEKRPQYGKTMSLIRELSLSAISEETDIDQGTELP